MSFEEKKYFCQFINCVSDRIDLYKTGWMLDSAVSVEGRDILFSAVAPTAHLVDISHDSHCHTASPLLISQ